MSIFLNPPNKKMAGLMVDYLRFFELAVVKIIIKTAFSK